MRAKLALNGINIPSFLANGKLLRYVQFRRLTSNDFRPISLLPVLSKVHYKTVMQLHRRPCHIFKNQSGFHKHHSTNIPLIKIRDDISNAVDWGKVTIAVTFITAFDTIDYFTLIRRLHSLNISTWTLKLIPSYLTDRS